MNNNVCFLWPVLIQMVLDFSLTDYDINKKKSSILYLYLKAKFIGVAVQMFCINFCDHRKHLYIERKEKINYE